MTVVRAGRPLGDLRVLELPGGVATRYCGKLFASFGAIVAARGGGDDRVIGGGDAAGVAYGRWLDAGKVAADGSPFATGGPDVIIAGQDAVAVAAGAQLASDDPSGPLLVTIRWFSPEGPYASWPATDETILAITGLAYSFGERGGRPTLAQGHCPQLLAGLNAFNAALGGLLGGTAARPRRIDVDVLESTMCLNETAAIAAAENPRARSFRLGVNRFAPTYPCSTYRAADGWVGVTCLTPSQWMALCTLIGRDDLAFDERFSTSVKRLVLADEVDEALVPAFAARTTDEWVSVGDRHRIPIVPVLEPAAVPHHRHWRERGSFVPFDAGPPAHAAAQPSTEETPLVEAPQFPFTMTFDGDAPAPFVCTGAAGPLTGLRVVDFTMGWAGPLATRYLADLGADVVKIESASHPDWWRGWEAEQTGEPPPIEIRSNFNALNRNKRGVSLELGTPEGLAAARALIAGADVVIDNFAAGVLDRLGLGADVQHALRPGVVSVSVPAFGSVGALAGLRAYGSTVEQASGLPFVNGEDSWPPSIQHVAFGDPVAGLYAVAAVLSALAGRERLGGSTLEVCQVECLFQLGADAVLAAQLAGGHLPRTGNRRLRASPCCVVPAAGDDQWLAVVVGDDAAWKGLCVVLGESGWAADPGLRTPAGRNQAADRIEAAVARWASDLSAGDAAARLSVAGVPAAPVQPSHALTEDPQLSAAGYWQTMERRYVGRHLQGGASFRLDGVRPVGRLPAPVLGEHTDEVLSALDSAVLAKTPPQRQFQATKSPTSSASKKEGVS